MRKILLTLLLVAISLGAAVAQNAKNTLNIDPASFRPVQTDVLTGVRIDEIGKDRSQRPCARIKLHVNRMTREEIDQLQVHIIGGMVALTKKVTAYEGNGLIIEMTAKPQTRFYLHHDKYGDSNEVMVDLEGNKEYFLDAQLDLLLSVAVASNEKGADVYLDGAYKGATGENYMLTIEDVTPGEHKITIKQGAAVAEQVVNVSSGNISFRIEVNAQTSRPQYVVFNVKPQNAMVFIDNKPITTNTSGIASTVLQNGTYAWRVMANGYHEQSGTFTISGAKVVKNVELVADAAMVTISAGEGAEIWVNNELKGKSPWRGQLLSGTYIFEARKAGHRTTTLSQTITSERAEQSYTLEVPIPIIGTVNVTSEPAMADVYVDGKNIGQTPLFADLLVGNHNLEIRHQGYNSTTQTVMVTEGNTAAVNVYLTKGDGVKITTPSHPTTNSYSTPTPAPTPAISSTPTPQFSTTGSRYNVGDYYNNNGKQGIVFWVDETGQHGKIISLTESPSNLQWTSDEQELKCLIGANDENNGANNMAKVKQISGWESKYPIFKWCADLGEGWYIPAIEELKMFTLDESVRKTVNRSLIVYYGTEIDIRYYWSSTEAGYHKKSGCAWSVLMNNACTSNRYKNYGFYVRAVAVF